MSKQTAEGIKSTVSDLSTAQEKQSGYISTLQQSAEGFDATVTKVNDLAVGGRNLYLNSRGLADGYGINGNVRVTVEPFDSTTNMWHIVAAQGTGSYSGIYLWNYCKGKIPDDSDWSYSADVKGTGKAVTFGIERDSNKPVKGNIRSEWSRISQTGHVDYGVKTLVMYFDTTDSPLDVYIKLPKLETGNIPTDWTPAPEDTATALAQIKITADSISKFVRDSSGNISSNFQTALSKTSIITGSTLATSIQEQTATQITSALTDNNGKIISLINQDTSGVQIAGKNIVLDGNTTVTGDFYAKGGNFKNLNASNLTVGTLNGSQVNITNINANNIVSGAISGANLNINLNTGSVVFQKGRINSYDYTTDINIDQGYISTANGDTRVILKNGQLQLTSPNYYDLQTNPYLSISNNPRTFDSTGQWMYSAVISARDRVVIGNKDGISSMLGDTYYIGQSSFYGLSSGKTIGSKIPTVVGGGATGVVLVGGSTYTNTIGGNDSPSIVVGWSQGGSTFSGNRVRINADYFHVGAVYNRTSSASSNVVVAADGAIVRSSSARKYKLDIKNDISIADSLKLIEVPLSTWVDKHEHEENGSNERYFGMIAEDLRDAGLEYLVQYGEDNEVEGINYDRVALLLIPLVKELKEHIEELESEGK